MEWSVALTSLIHPSTPAVVLPIFEFTDVQVSVELNGQRTAQATLLIADVQNALDDLGIDVADFAYATALQLAWRDTPMFWGVVTVPSVSAQNFNVTCSAVDRSLSLQSHYLNLGDAALDSGNGFGGKVPPDYRGLRMLRDSADLTSAEVTDGWAVLGIKDGTANTAESDSTTYLQFERFYVSAWDAQVQVANQQHGPDFELEPNFSDPAYYANLNVYDRQGTDKSDTVRLQHSFGGDDLDEFVSEPGGKLINQSLSVARDGKTRSDWQFNTASSRKFGKYERVDATNYKAASAALNRDAARWVKLYGEPLDAVTVTPSLRASEDPEAFWPVADFWVGDTISAEFKRDGFYKQVKGRVTAIRLRQADESGNTAYEVDLVPERLADADIETRAS